ncbi:MAG: DUF748 domain-containing protein [Desulfobacteraceae bacterium]|nr:MAG: DUF748 domain-containing protein [Desulfobacteraceae bacterium]
MKTVRKVFIIMAGIFAVYSILGFFVLPPVARSFLSKNLGKALNRKVTIQEIKANPYKLTIEIKGLSVQEKEKPIPFFTFQEMKVNLSGMSLFKFAPVVEELILKGPYLRIEHIEKGDFNFSDIIAGGGDKKEEQESAPMTPGFSFSNIQIEQGVIDFIDRPKKKTHKMEGLLFNLPFFSNFPYHARVHVKPVFKAVIDGAPLDLSGASLPFVENKETSLSLDVRGIDLARYMAYVPLDLSFELEKGLLDIAVALGYEIKAGGGAKLIAKGEIHLRDTKILDHKGESLLALPSLSILLAESDLIAGNLHLGRVALQSPELRVARDAEGALNLVSLIPRNTSSGKDGKEKDSSGNNQKDKAATAIHIDEVTITGGRAGFLDQFVKGGFKASISDLDLKVSGYSSKPESLSAVELSFNTESGGNFKTKGSFCLDPLWGEGGISIGPIPISDFEPYYRENILFEILKGNIRLQSDYKFSLNGEKKDVSLLISEISLDLKDMALRKKGEKELFFQTRTLGIRGASFDLTGKELIISDFSTKDGKVFLERNKDGTINLGTLLPSTPSGNSSQEKNLKGSEAPSPWTILLKGALVDGYSVDFTDLSNPSAVKVPVHKLRIEAKDITNKKDSWGSLALSFDMAGQGEVSIKGDVALSPPAAKLETDLSDIHIKSFQPYWMPYLNLVASKGNLSLKGRLTLAPGPSGETSWEFKGNTYLRDLTTIEKDKAEEFFKWRSLEAKGLSLASPPLAVSVEGIDLFKPFCRIHVDKDGTLNVQKLLRSRDSEDKNKPSDKSNLTINLKTISLKDGILIFRDRSVSPAYSTNLSGINLNLKGLTTDKFKKADILFTANLDGSAPLRITGKLNPLIEDIFADLEIGFKGIALSPMTPYSGKYIGYAIEKGNLSLDLKYSIEKMKLEATNKIVFDQFTFGKTVDSPQATSLPVALAVALLKNRSGVIELDLPVTGRLDDPQFSVGAIILKMIVNILEKAITSPFALLGAVFGGGEELSHFDFGPGLSVIAGGNAAALDKLIDILYERPALRLEILGYVDEKSDTEALRQQRFLNKIKSLKIKEMAQKGLTIPPLDELTIEPQERLRYVSRLFEQNIPAKAGDKEAKTKAPSLEEMEKDLISKTDISGDDLRILAHERTISVKDYILKSGKVTPERIFVVGPGSLEPEKKEGLIKSRVDFKLK